MEVGLVCYPVVMDDAWSEVFVRGEERVGFVHGFPLVRCDHAGVGFLGLGFVVGWSWWGLVEEEEEEGVV